jgi:hypothetical protein
VAEKKHFRPQWPQSSATMATMKTVNRVPTENLNLGVSHEWCHVSEMLGSSCCS